jgi:hypothetical protein
LYQTARYIGVVYGVDVSEFVPKSGLKPGKFIEPPSSLLLILAVGSSRLPPLPSFSPFCLPSLLFMLISIAELTLSSPPSLCSLEELWGLSLPSLDSLFREASFSSFLSKVVFPILAGSENYLPLELQKLLSELAKRDVLNFCAEISEKKDGSGNNYRFLGLPSTIQSLVLHVDLLAKKIIVTPKKCETLPKLAHTLNFLLYLLNENIFTGTISLCSCFPTF